MNAAKVSAQTTFYKTTSMCPTCERLVPGEVVGTPHGVFLVRECPDHGPFEGLVCSDLAWYESLPRFDVPPVKPKSPLRKTEHGCPNDCGLCTAHRQIAGTAAIEISNRCDASCPVCIADNQKTFELSVDEVSAMVDDLVRAQGTIDVLAISGGEPAIHPDLFAILRAVSRPEVQRIALNSNGLRMAHDDGFLDELARFDKVYVTLHYDGAGAKALRGVDPQVQERAVERLGAWKIPMVPVVLAAQGINDLALGTIVPSLLRRPSVKSVIVSTMAFAGSGGATFQGDPRTRLTIPGALDCIEAGSGGALRKRDFIPLPMPNPLCAAIGYFLVDQGELTGLIGLGDLDEVIECTKNTNFVTQDEDLERLLRSAVDRLYASEALDAPRILGKFRGLLDRLFPEATVAMEPSRRRSIVEEQVKTVYLMQLMDAWTFDTKRLSKCSCQHLLPGGSVIPSCSYYAYHRKRDPRFAADLTPPRLRAPTNSPSPSMGRGTM
jgi:uncharacterized radical SAM superfamily Fe-S cluster-containing enzyme